MPALYWDRQGTRKFESGLDRGVIYLEDGSGVVWNGLVSVNEKVSSEINSVYFDGKKINDFIKTGEFSAEVKAVTYPDELVTLEGYGSTTGGVFYGEQRPQLFNMSYRTFVGNDLDGAELGYKLHILYNVIATPNDTTYATFSDDPTIVEFSWNITTIPEDVVGHAPTSHIVIDSRKVDPQLLTELERLLYGDYGSFAALPSFADLITLMETWYTLLIVDNGDGTWTATAKNIDDIVVDGLGQFTINNANAIFLDAVTYEIYTSRSALDTPLIAIELYDDGTWTATSEHPELITINPDGSFSITNATVEFSGPDIYRISDTP